VIGFHEFFSYFLYLILREGVNMKPVLSKMILVLTVVAIWAITFAQMAPRETVNATVGGRKVSVEYGRPSLKGRSFEELTKQLPADRMWRTGSEQITTLTTEGPIMIGGKTIPPGKYSVYIHCPETGDYSLALNSVLGQPLKNIWAAAPDNLANEPWPHYEYQKEIGDSEVARIPLKKETSASPVDLFTITMKQSGGSTHLSFAWGTHNWSTDIKAPMREGS
jgi:hypothetical protein